MKHFILTTIFFLSLYSSNWAQYYNQQVGYLTIISEENEPFILYINNKKYNQTPSKGVRVEDIQDKYVQVKIEFANKRLATITENNLPIADLEGYMQDITYSISSNRRGARAFNVYEVIPMAPIQINERDFEVYTYGNTKKTRMSDRARDRWNNQQNNYRNGRNRHQPNYGGGRQSDNCTPVNNQNFSEFINTLNNNSFENNKLELVQIYVNQSCLLTHQIVDIMNCFSFDNNKLEVAKMAYKNCLDPQNYFKVSDALTFSSNKTTLNKYIQGLDKR